MTSLVEGRGFMFSLPPHAPNPLTSYAHARWLEEGCLYVSKTTLEERDACRKAAQNVQWRFSTSEAELEGESGGKDMSFDDKDHPNLRLQWTWSELQR